MTTRGAVLVAGALAARLRHADRSEIAALGGTAGTWSGPRNSA